MMSVLSVMAGQNSGPGASPGSSPSAGGGQAASNAGGGQAATSGGFGGGVANSSKSSSQDGGYDICSSSTAPANMKKMAGCGKVSVRLSREAERKRVKALRAAQAEYRRCSRDWVCRTQRSHRGQ